jgi:hypothetical protein
MQSSLVWFCSAPPPDIGSRKSRAWGQSQCPGVRMALARLLHAGGVHPPPGRSAASRAALGTGQGAAAAADLLHSAAKGKDLQFFCVFLYTHAGWGDTCCSRVAWDTGQQLECQPNGRWDARHAGWEPLQSPRRERAVMHSAKPRPAAAQGHSLGLGAGVCDCIHQEGLGGCPVPFIL